MKLVAVFLGAVLGTGPFLASDPLFASETCESLGLRDVAAERGLEFQHVAGRSAAKHLPETMGAGVAWLDYDNDGDMDLYTVQSGSYPPDGSPPHSSTTDGSAVASDRLWSNRGDGSFEDVTQQAGIDSRGYGQGVVAADVNGDGWTDLLVLNDGPDLFLENQGDGTFADRTTDWNLATPGWSSAAAFNDADGDGDLDLYVVRYVDYDPADPLFCGDLDRGERRYCDPSLFQGSKDAFLLQDSGRFQSAPEAPVSSGKGLGVVFVDLDGDRRPEIYVTNDITPNHLLLNKTESQETVFEDVSFFSGAAANREGAYEAGMGIAVGDVDGDGDPDIGVTNFDVETNTLYLNQGTLGGMPQLEDVSAASGYGVPSFNLLGFGLIAADLDLDRDLDFYVANGHIFEQPQRKSVQFRQRDLLLLGDGRGAFQEVDCPVLAVDPQLGRGLAAGDPDNDGDLDLAVANNDGPLQLRENTIEGDWLVVQLAGAAPNAGAVGAAVELRTAGGQSLWRWVMAGDSYQSSSDPRVFLGLGDDNATSLQVEWPSGKRLRLVVPPTQRFLRFTE